MMAETTDVSYQHQPATANIRLVTIHYESSEENDINNFWSSSVSSYKHITQKSMQLLHAQYTLAELL